MVAVLAQEGDMRAETESASGSADAPVLTRRRRRLIVYVDVRRGEGVTDTGERSTFGARAQLSEVLQGVPQLGEANQVRLWLCGELLTDASGSYEGWVLARELRQRSTTGARGYSLSDERPEETVARYRRRGSSSRREIDNETVWYSVPAAREGYGQQFDHPEWAAQVWARCRACIPAPR